MTESSLTFQRSLQSLQAVEKELVASTIYPASFLLHHKEQQKLAG